MRLPWTAEEDATIRDMRARGVSWAKIAAEIGAAIATVHYRGKKMGLVGPKKARPNRRRPINSCRVSNLRRREVASKDPTAFVKVGRDRFAFHKVGPVAIPMFVVSA